MERHINNCNHNRQLEDISHAYGNLEIMYCCESCPSDIGRQKSFLTDSSEQIDLQTVLGLLEIPTSNVEK